MALDLRPGFVHYAAFPDVATENQVRQTIGLVVEHGFEVIECSSLLGPALLGVAAREIHDHGRTLFLSAGPEFVRAPLSLCDLDTDMRDAAVNRSCELIDLATATGAANLMLVSGGDPGPERRLAARPALVGSLQKIEEHAGAKGGPRITIETFPRDRAPAQYLGPTVEALAVVDELASDEFGLTTDLSHLVQLGEDLRPSVAALSRRSSHFHLATCVLQTGHPLDGDRHPTFDEPGIALTLVEAVTAVGESARSGSVVSVEMRRHHGERPIEFLKVCAEYIRRLMAREGRA